MLRLAVMKHSVVGTFGFAFLSASLLAACDAAVGDDGGGGGGGGAAGVAGKFAATYEVPVPAELADAAVFPVAEVEWSVVNGVATLEYDLPLGLVGKAVKVEFQGAADAASTSASLTGPAGTADCTISPTTVVCNEQMSGLLPMSPDYAVIEELAATEYSGPAANRIDVAKQFAGDPIGIVHVDLTKAAVDDDGVDVEDDHVETEHD
jgi:hypothetical protein